MPPSQVTLEVPEGSSPGSILQLCVQGQTLQVAVPDGAVPGTVLALEIPDPGLEQHGDDDEIGSDQSDEANSLIAVGDSDTVYVFGLANVAATTYTAVAAPLAGQLKRDTDCGTLTLNQSGARAATGTADDCWR